MLAALRWRRNARFSTAEWDCSTHCLGVVMTIALQRSVLTLDPERGISTKINIFLKL